MKLLAFLLLFGCRDRDHDLVRDKPPQVGSGSAVQKLPPPLGSLEHMTYTLPASWQAAYDAPTKSWRFTTSQASAHLTRFTAALVPTPADYLAMRKQIWDQGTTAEISEQHQLADGFEMTVTVKPAVDPAHPKRETYVVRKSNGSLIDCKCEHVPDEPTREQVIAICTSATL